VLEEGKRWWPAVGLTLLQFFYIWFVVEYVCQLISFLRILCVEALCGENARRRMEKRSWKEDLRGAMLVANHNLEKLSTIFCFMRFMFFWLTMFAAREVVSNFSFLLRKYSLL
jgi:hypothetical protein